MSVLALQAGIISGAIGLVGITTTYLTLFHDPAPRNWVLSDDTSSSTKYTNKYAYSFLKDFVDPAEKNKEWWEWSFKYLKKKGINSGKFATQGTDAKITDAFKNDSDTDKDKALNQVCKKAYESEFEKVKENAAQNDEYPEEEVWIYCSNLSKKPIIISQKN